MVGAVHDTRSGLVEAPNRSWIPSVRVHRATWIIPAAFISLVLGIAGCAVALVSWFAIVITGMHPRGMWDFLRAVRAGATG
jgi:hypothetical protein